MLALAPKEEWPDSSLPGQRGIVLVPTAHQQSRTLQIYHQAQNVLVKYAGSRVAIPSACGVLSGQPGNPTGCGEAGAI